MPNDVITYRRALLDLVRAHNGYRHGMGPCSCAAHENARKLLGITRNDETPPDIGHADDSPGTVNSNP